MKTKEIIEALQKYNPEAEFVVRHRGAEYGFYTSRAGKQGNPMTCPTNVNMTTK